MTSSNKTKGRDKPSEDDEWQLDETEQDDAEELQDGQSGDDIDADEDDGYGASSSSSKKRKTKATSQGKGKGKIKSQPASADKPGKMLWTQGERPGRP